MCCWTTRGRQSDRREQSVPIRRDRRSHRCCQGQNRCRNPSHFQNRRRNYRNRCRCGNRNHFRCRNSLMRTNRRWNQSRCLIQNLILVQSQAASRRCSHNTSARRRGSRWHYSHRCRAIGSWRERLGTNEGHMRNRLMKQRFSCFMLGYRGSDHPSLIGVMRIVVGPGCVPYRSLNKKILGLCCLKSFLSAVVQAT